MITLANIMTWSDGSCSVLYDCPLCGLSNCIYFPATGETTAKCRGCEQSAHLKQTKGKPPDHPYVLGKTKVEEI